MRGNFFYKKLGKRIIDTRRIRHLSQEKLALMSDMDRTYLSRLEKGRINPTIRMLHKLCRCLKVKLHQLVKDL
jgi:transcriptional regulator with XRE-family HTH domain